MKKVGKSKNTRYTIRNLKLFEFMSIENPVTYVPIRHLSTTVENLLQINSFMPNKPNVKIGKISLSIVIIKNYDDEHRKNEQQTK
jgi:hypothetical protein